jgi:hypothetical protein
MCSLREHAGQVRMYYVVKQGRSRSVRSEEANKLSDYSYTVSKNRREWTQMSRANAPLAFFSETQLLFNAHLPG